MRSQSDGFKQRLFFRFAKKRRAHALRNLRTLLLFGSENVGGALGASQKVLAVFLIDENDQRFQAPRDQQQIIGFRRQHRINGIVTCALFLQMHLETIMEEGQKIGQHRLGRCFRLGANLLFIVGQCVVDILLAVDITGVFPGKLGFKLAQLALDLTFFERGKGRTEERQQRELPFLRQQEADHAQCRTTQSKRILRPRRLFVNCPEADQRVELIGKRDGNRNRVFWHNIGRALRLVVFFNRSGDGFIFALKKRIFATHCALKFREFADNFRGEVSLCQNCRARSKLRIGTHQRRNLRSQFANAFNACALRAKLGMEGHIERIQTRHALIERLLQIKTELFRRSDELVEVGQIMLIGVPEIERIRQACAHDLAVAIGDFRATIAGCNVRHQNELVGKRLRFALLAGDEALLVGADGEANDFRRNGQKLFLEFAHQHDRPFDQTGHFFQKPIVFDQLKTGSEGEIMRVLRNDFLAALGVENHESLFEFFDIILEATYLDWLTVAQETMAIGDITRLDAIDIEIDDHGFLGFGTEGAEDRLQRTHPTKRTRLGRSGTPAHGFRPWEIADRLRYQFGDDFFGCAARFRQMGDIEIALLRIGMHMSLRHIRQTGLAQKTLNGLFRRCDRRTLNVFMHVLGTHGEAANIERQTTWRPIRGRSFIGKTGFHQTIGNHLLQITSSLALHASGDFFGKEFEQQIRHVLYSPSRLKLKPPASVKRNASPH